MVRLLLEWIQQKSKKHFFSNLKNHNFQYVKNDNEKMLFVHIVK
ncbi:hypothetical protein MTsPCn9_10790 [Croceitalea sp. MTPC9]|nr:hypothetical protein MTsPCn6_26450 [Croceitalea sp. MTPC6]GMN16143.1 hypothetical protein MTsPCn9_10790 [Croceitalea sp. MTPC9]